MRMKHLIKQVALAVVLSTAAFAVQAEVVAVVGADSSVSSLNKAQVSEIFLGKVSSFPSGEEAVPIDRAEGAAVRDAFYGEVTGKNASQVKAYWSKRIFTGKGQPPKVVEDVAKLKELLNKNPNLIGYIDSSNVDDSVKVVFQP